MKVKRNKDKAMGDKEFNCETCLRGIRIIVSVVCAVLLFIFGGEMEVYADEIIPKSEFEDENFYQHLIRNYDTNGDGAISYEEAEAVSQMTVYVYRELEGEEYLESLTSIKGIKYFKNLTQLVINGFYTDGPLDISEIGTLTNLELLGIEGMKIQNAQAINSLIKLDNLRLFRCGLSDISFMGDFPMLRVLDLERNSIVDYSPVVKYGDTLDLLCIGNFLDDSLKLTADDLSFVMDMKHLFTLNAVESGITELPDFKEHPRLSNVWLYGNSITLSEAENKLPEYITSQENWVDNTGMFYQVEVEEESGATDGGGTSDDEGSSGETDEDTAGNNNQSNTDNGNQGNAGENDGSEGQANGNTSENTAEEDNENNVDNVDNEDETDEMDNGEDESTRDEANDVNQEEDNQNGGTDNNNQLSVDDSVYTQDMEIKDIRADFEIHMYGSFSSGVYVVAKKIEELSEYLYDVKKLYDMIDDIDEVLLYEISVYDKLTHKRVQPNGMVKVSIRLDEKYISSSKTSKYYVYRLDEYGEWISVECKISEGMIHFYSDHFSVYSIVISQMGDELENKLSMENVDEYTSTKADKTGGKVNAAVASIVTIVIGVAGILGYEVIRKRWKG